MQATCSSATTTKPTAEEAMRIIARSTDIARENLAAQAQTKPNLPAAQVLREIPKPPAPSPEEIERVREERRTRALAVAQRLWEASGTPARYLDADLDAMGDDTPPEQIKVIARLKSLREDPSILGLIGTRGTGKTAMGIGTIRDYCRHGKQAKYLRAMDLFRAIRSTFGGKNQSEAEIVAKYTRPDLIVIDEIQVRSESEWENNVLIDLIDARYAAMKSTIVIGNLAPDALVKNLGESISSRLQEAGGIVVCKWASYRANGKAKSAAQPIRDPNSDEFQFTPVVPGATPNKAGWAGRMYTGG